MKEKIISWILVFTMCLSMLPANVFAEAAESGTGEQALAVAEKEPEPEPEADPVTEPITEPEPEPVTEPETEPIAEPVTEPETDPEVARVQALLDALPAAEELTEEDLEALENAYEAYLSLTEAQQAQILGSERFDELFAYLNGQVSPLAATGWDESMENGKRLITLTDYQGTEQIKLTGATILELHGSSSITCGTPIDLNHESLTIRGTGTLELTAEADKPGSGAINESGFIGGTVTLESGTLICKQATECAGSGIFATTVNVTGGRLEAYGAYGGCGIWSRNLNVSGESAVVYAVDLHNSDAIHTDNFQMNDKLAVLYADTSSAKEEDMQVGTSGDVGNHKTVCIQKYDKPMLSVGEQQGNLYARKTRTATFALTGRNVSKLTVDWIGAHTGLEASTSADGKTLTVTATYPSAGTYTLNLTAVGTDGTTTVTKSISITVSNFQMALTKDPQSILVNKRDSAYQNAKLTIEVQASEVMSYQWYYRSGTSTQAIDGQTTNELYVKDIPEAAFTQSESGNWKSTAMVCCEATYDSSNGLVSSMATVTVVDCPDHQGYYDDNGVCTRCGEQAGVDFNWVCDGRAYQGNRIENMVGAGKTVYLLHDIDALEAGTVPANVTVDLNGHTVDGLAVEKFQDTIIQNGTIQGLYLPDNGKNTGTVTLKKLTVSSGAKISDGANVTVGEGCVFQTKLVLDKIIRLTAGTFENGIQLSGNLNWEDLLPVGYGCYKKDGSLIRFTMVPYANYLKVAPHTCTWDSFGTCTDCGRACRHPNTDADGKCAACGLVSKPFAVGSQAYATPEEALEAASDGDTVTMHSNYRLPGNVPLTVSKQVTLDTGGYTLISDYSDQTGATLVVSGGDLTLRGNIQNDYTAKAVPAILVKDGGKLTVKSGAVSGGMAGIPDGISGHTGSEILVEGGNINALSTNGKLTVTGGQVENLFIPLHNAEIQLSGGSFGSICSTNTTKNLTAAERGALLEKYYAYYAEDGTPVKLSLLTNGTKVTVQLCAHPEGISADDACPYCGQTCQHESLDANGKCETCKLQVSEARGGSGTVYRTLKEALDAGESSVTLLRYAELSDDPLPSVELDLGGNLLWINGVLYTGNGTNLTVKGPGELHAGGIAIQSGGTLTISGDVNAYSAGVVGNYGTFKMNGGQVNTLICNPGSTTVLSAGKITTVQAPNGKTVADLLATGKAFYRDGNAVDGYQTKLDDGPYEIKDHTHSIGEDGSCSCGYQPEAQLTIDGKSEYADKLTDALAKAQEAEGTATVKLLTDIAYSVTVSKQLTLDFNGHTLEKLVANGVSPEDLLPEGCAYKSNGQWVSDAAGLTELENVTAARVPIQSVTAKNPSVTVTYGEPATLQVLVKCDPGTGSYAWYYVTDNGSATELTGLSSLFTTPSDLPVGTHTYRYTFTQDGYSKSCDFKVTVNKITNKIRNKDYPTQFTYGDSIPEPKRENFTVEGWDESQLEFVWRTADYTVVTSPKDAGTYTLYIKLGGDKNHNAVSQTVDITVAKKALTVTAKDHTITYGDAPAGNGVRYEGFVDGEDESVLSGELAYTSDYRQYGDVGSYTVTPTSLTSQNYDITYQSGTLTVEPRPIEVEWSNTTFTYDGQPQAPAATVKNAVNGDKPTLEVSGAQTNAGENYRAEVTKITGDKAGNYRIAENTATDFTINKAKWKYTAPTARNRTYNGRLQQLLKSGTVENGGTFTYTFNGHKFDTGDIYGTNAGEYQFSWVISGDQNHEEASGNLVVTVAPKNIADNDITVTLGEGLAYNGKEQAQSIASVKFGSLAVTYEVADNTGTDAGKYTMKLRGTGNYQGTRNVPFTIAQKALTVTAEDHTIIYGDAPAGNGVRYEGFVDGEDESVLSGELAYTSDYRQYGDVGSYTVTPTSLTSQNYDITYQSGTLTVEPRPIEVEWSNTTFTYNGQPQAPTAAVKNAVNGDKLTLEVSGAQTNAGENYKAEVTKITGGKAGNYYISVAPETQFTINKAQWNYTPPQAVTGLTYSGQAQALIEPGTVEDGGKLGYFIGNAGNYMADIPARMDTGTYRVRWCVKEDSNHYKASGDMYVTIAPKNIGDTDVTVTLGEKLTYNGQTQTQSIASVMFGSLNATYTVTGNSGKEAGTYTMTLTGTGNYYGTRKITFTIAQKALTVTAEDHTITYGDAPANNGVRYDGFASGDDASSLGGTLAYTYDYQQYGNTGDYKITPSGLESKNYAITYEPGTLTVGRKPVILTAKVAEKSFDNSCDAQVTLTLNGIENPDANSVQVDTGKAAFAQRIPGTWEVSYDRPCRLTGDKAINYDLQPANPKMQGTIRANGRFLDVTNMDELDKEGFLTVEDQLLPIDEANVDGKVTRYVDLGDTTGLATTYTYEKGTPAQTSDNYPTGMKVYRINRADSGATLEPISAFDDLLQYVGSSIRISGKPGIRMITGVDSQTKRQLIAGTLEGFSLVEYGTVVQWQDTLGDANLTKGSGKHNYAYKVKAADPIFGKDGSNILYTNVLVWDSLTDEQYNAGIVMRPYMVLKDTQTGEEHTVYGGCVTRSIVYIAKQNVDTYKPGTKGYKYIQDILARAK